MWSTLVENGITGPGNAPDVTGRFQRLPVISFRLLADLELLGDVQGRKTGVRTEAVD
jgi:hypothetical protein